MSLTHISSANVGSGQTTYICDSDELHFRQRQRFDQLLRWGRTCAICRSIWPPIDLVCESCQERLLAVANRGSELKQKDYPFPVHSLWTWDDGRDALLRPVLNAFKGGYAYRFAKLAAEVLVHERSPGRMDRVCFLYPRHTKSDFRDHAWLLAQTFASMWPGRMLIFGLVPSNADAGIQKLKTVVDRSRIRFAPLDPEKISHLSIESATWIFIDDVITSGATALAAFMASGEPHSFEVWTLACRPKLAGKSQL